MQCNDNNTNVFSDSAYSSLNWGCEYIDFLGSRGIHTRSALSELVSCYRATSWWGTSRFQRGSADLTGATAAWQRLGILHQGRVFPCSSLCSDCLAAQWNVRRWGCFSSSCAGRSLEKDLMWTATSRNECGGFLLLSRCFPRALTDEISLCSGVGGSFHPNANREACRSLPELGSQPHRATPATSWCMSARGGKHRSRPWTAVPLQQHFTPPPRKWPAFQQRGHWKCFAAGIFGAEELWQRCTAGVRVRVWLLCRQSALQWELPPTIRVSWLGTSWYLLLLLCVEGAHLQTPASGEQPVSSPIGIPAWADGGDCTWTELFVHATMLFSLNSWLLLRGKHYPKGQPGHGCSSQLLHLVPGHAAHVGLGCDCVMSHVQVGGWGELCLPGWALLWAPLAACFSAAASKDAKRHVGPLQPHNFWLRQNKEQRELLEGVCTSKRIIRLCPQGGSALDCNCLPTLMMARYLPKPFNRSNCACLSQSPDVMLGFLPVPFGILCGGRSNFFSFLCDSSLVAVLWCTSELLSLAPWTLLFSLSPWMRL